MTTFVCLDELKFKLIYSALFVIIIRVLLINNVIFSLNVVRVRANTLFMNDSYECPFYLIFACRRIKNYCLTSHCIEFFISAST